MSDTTIKNSEFDRVWEQRYQDPGYRNHYPWSSVVQFVFRHRPRGRQPSDIGILEVGCGNGSNLWFAAREGFRTAGIDASETAISHARKWFARENLASDFHVGSFTKLPFSDAMFDLVVDRAALSFVGADTVKRALSEIHRVLRPGGLLMFTPYSDRSTSFDGLPDADGCYRKVTRGPIKPGAQVRFYSPTDVRHEFEAGWELKVFEHNERTDFLGLERVVHAEWYVVAAKK